MDYWLFAGAIAQANRFSYCQELLVCLLVAKSVKALRGKRNAISLEQSLFSEIRESKSKNHHK